MENLNQSLSVDESGHGSRLDAFLAVTMPELSRSQWKPLIQRGAVRVNDTTSKPNYKLKTGDTLCWTLPEKVSTEPQAEEIPLNILFEDEAVLVINKPPGLVVHPAPGNESGTLMNALLFHDQVFQTLERAGIVHRLDKDTSGVMVVAKSEKAIEELQRQFKARETEKEYLALVWGSLIRSQRVENLIGRNPRHRKKQTVLEEGGRVAISNFQTVEKFDEVSLVKAKIETGRTHQIRVHLTSLGHSIVGDSLYGRARKNKLPLKPSRQMLHAEKLSFSHPDSGERLSFEAPLFDDMRQLLEQLREENG